VERRRRIRDISHAGQRWIVSVIAEDDDVGVWRGRAVFFLDASEPEARRMDDTLCFEALAFEELVAQVSALSVDELRNRLDRVSGGNAP
jgi:hypothetical protein